MAKSPSPATTQPGPEQAPPPPESFEAALTELEGIVARMEGGDLSLEQSLRDYKRGAQLLQFCQNALRDAQQQVKVLEDGMLQDFAGGEQQD
jgi:exodeoxyribonuclease VII small subunit